MGLYDVNLKKTAIGYQFDHNVYIGYQINDNRVVTFKDLGTYAASFTGGGGGGGSGGIETVNLTVNGQTIQLTADGQAAGGGTVVVSTLSPLTSSIPNDAKVCVIDDEGDVYRTTSTWDSIATQLAQLGLIQITTPTAGITEIAAVSGTLRIDGRATTAGVAEQVAQPLTLTIGSTTHTYNGSQATSIALGTIGTVVASTVAIALPSAQSANDNDIPTIGYIKNSGLGGNVYSTDATPDGPKTSDGDTKFIFVEDN